MIVTLLIAELHNTVRSCSQHSVAAFRLTYEWPGSVISLSETVFYWLYIHIQGLLLRM